MTTWGLNLHPLSSMSLVKVMMLFWTKIVTSAFVSTLFTSPRPPRAFWISNGDGKITQWWTTREPSVAIVWISILLTPGMRAIFGLAWLKAWKHKGVANLWPCACFVCPKLLQNSCTMSLRSFLKRFLFFLFTFWVNGSRQIPTRNPLPWGRLNKNIF